MGWFCHFFKERIPLRPSSACVGTWQSVNVRSVCESDCLCRGVCGYLRVYACCVCLCVSMLCLCVFVLPGCVWLCQAIWSAVWGAHYPLSSAVGSGALSICPSSLSLHPTVSPFLSFSSYLYLLFYLSFISFFFWNLLSSSCL